MSGVATWEEGGSRGWASTSVFLIVDTRAAGGVSSGGSDSTSNVSKSDFIIALWYNSPTLLRSARPSLFFLASNRDLSFSSLNSFSL